MFAIWLSRTSRSRFVKGIIAFLYLFAKNERDNITEKERAALSEIGDQYMKLSASMLDELVTKRILIEVAPDARKEDKPNSR